MMDPLSPWRRIFGFGGKTGGPRDEPAATQAEALTQAEVEAQADERARKLRYFYLGDHTALAELHTGHCIYVDTRDLSLTPNLLWSGRWEPWVEAAMAEVLRPGMTVLDVGANYGYFALIASRLVGDRGKVFAVEAHPRLARLLRQSVNANGLRHIIECFECAAHEDEGEVTLNFIPEFFGDSSVVRDASAAAPLSDSVAVPTRRLDRLLPPDTRIDVMKIDIEGGEFHAFRGMGALLEGGHPMTIFCEFLASDVMRFQPPAQYLTGFATRGFTLHLSTPHGVTPPLTPEEIVARAGAAPLMLLMHRG